MEANILLLRGFGELFEVGTLVLESVYLAVFVYIRPDARRTPFDPFASLTDQMGTLRGPRLFASLGTWSGLRFLRCSKRQPEAIRAAGPYLDTVEWVIPTREVENDKACIIYRNV